MKALVYVGIGYYYKDKIKVLMEDDAKRYDLIAIITAMGLVVFIWLNYRNGNGIYYFDMKPVYYKDLIGAILIPCAFGIVITRCIHQIVMKKHFYVINGFLSLCGQTTLPIMFMHVPLNHWKNSLGYGLFIFLLIGIGVPLLIVIVFNKFKLARKLLGISHLGVKTE